MGNLLNIDNECIICGRRILTGEKYCKKHKDFSSLDSADREELMEEDEKDEREDE